MALSHALSEGGSKPTAIHTTADVKLDQEGAGFKISSIALSTTVTAAGLEDAKFQGIAAETKKQCPVSKALAGTEITLTAKLG